MTDSITLDMILEAYSPGAYFEPVHANDDGPSFNGVWFTNYVAGPNGFPAPSIETVNGVAEQLVSTGGALDFDAGMNGFVGIMTTAAFAKIMEAADKNAAILLYGVIAIASMVLYLFAPSAVTGGLARAGWSRFALYAKRFRSITGITNDDIIEFNQAVETFGLPDWLKLT